MQFDADYDETRKANCGKLVSQALQSIGGKATSEFIIQKIFYDFGAVDEATESELKQVLGQAVRDGFLVKMGNSYAFPNYEMDATSRHSMRTSMRKKNRGRTAIASRSQNKRRRAQSKGKSKSRSRSRSRQRKPKSDEESN